MLATVALKYDVKHLIKINIQQVETWNCLIVPRVNKCRFTSKITVTIIVNCAGICCFSWIMVQECQNQTSDVPMLCSYSFFHMNSSSYSLGLFLRHLCLGFQPARGWCGGGACLRGVVWCLGGGDLVVPIPGQVWGQDFCVVGFFCLDGLFRWLNPFSCFYIYWEFKNEFLDSKCMFLICCFSPFVFLVGNVLWGWKFHPEMTAGLHRHCTFSKQSCCFII